MKAICFAVCCSLFSLAAVAQFNDYVGIGVRLQIDSTQGYYITKITSFIPGGSAEHSGLLVGDELLKIDDKTATRLPLADVVKLILGEEGTKIKLEVKQKGSPKTFVLTRKKVHAATIQYTPKVNSDFCTALSQLMNDAPYHFVNTIDSTTFREEDNGFKRDVYPSKIQLSGVKEVCMVKSFGTSCSIRIGSYNSVDEVNKKGEAFVAQIKTCFPDYYYFSHAGTESNSIQIGIKAEGRYSSAVASIYSYLDKTTQQYRLDMRIDEGVPKVFYTIEKAADGSDLSKALLQIYGEVSNDFGNIKTKEYKSDNMFNPAYYYDINVTVPMAGKCYVDNGDLSSLNPNQCLCYFYSGTSKTDANEAFGELADMVRDALGSEFVFTFDRPEELFSQVLPQNAEKVVIFAKKKQRGYESLPLCSLVFTEVESGTYRVYLDFYKSGI